VNIFVSKTEILPIFLTLIPFQHVLLSEATVSRFLRDIRHEVEVDEMCAKVVQEVKVTTAVKDRLDVKVTEEINAAESDHASFPAGGLCHKVRLLTLSFLRA